MPHSGDIHWEFSPHGDSGEMLYSQPTVDGERLFMGDRAGWLYCLDVRTGQLIWKRLTNDGNLDQNATAVVTDGLVITGTNAKLAVAYAVSDGRPAWQTELEGPCTHHLFVSGEKVVVAASCIHLLKPSNGVQEGQIHWPGLSVALLQDRCHKYSFRDAKPGTSKTPREWEERTASRRRRCLSTSIRI
jgi:outer membrane protein assembly factor BamB